MINIFSGTDTFESYLRCKMAASKVAKKSNLPIKIIDADDVENIDDILVELEGVGMFASQNIIILKRALKNKKLVDYLIKHFEKMNALDFYIWEDKNLDGKLKIVKLLKKESKISDYSLPKPWELKKWFAGFVKKKNIKLTSFQTEFILERNENKWLLYSIIKKIETFLNARNKKSLSDKELESILGTDAKGDIWKFVDYFGEKKIDKLINEFNKINSFEENSQYLIAMINRELEIMLSIKRAKEEGVSLKELKLHPFVLQKANKKASRFKFDSLKKLLENLINLEIAIKTGLIGDKIGLKLYLYKLKNV